ncbi:chondroitin sulfate synthase 1 [Copidosoma floridanum]|uniref:chondroitin sulfate synthase 1 n=1 Tax=Copidosoma floridanum TaxID=29053 RepID=UPI000C6FA4D2|nr:chondroitin sulfate synthase 1 [Copidosoma floridanum]
MTARRYLGTRAKAVYESWGAEVPGRIGFYSSEGSVPPDNCPGLPLLGLPGVDDSYPPQKKSFLMLEHMWTRYGERYEWFLRADDDLYVRMDRLERLLRSVDSRRAHYIGQAGRGSSEERGRLALDYDENFCMGGPGVIMSRETLRRIVPHIKTCLGNLYTGHEDVELGRCVRKYAGIPCTWNYEMQTIFYHNSSGELAFTGKLKSKEVHQAITMHPVKKPPHMYRLHNYMRTLKIQELQHKRLELQRDIERMDRFLQSESGSAKGVSDEKKESDRQSYGSSHWDFISRSEFRVSDANPRRRIHGDVREGLDDIIREVMTQINSCSRQRGRYVEERQALYAYRSRNSRGINTVLDLLLVYKKYRGRKVTLPVRRHLHLHQPFTGVESRVLPTEDADEQVIHFLVPVSGRRRALERFLGNYERVCLRSSEQSAQLHIVLYDGQKEEQDNEVDGVSSRELIERLRSKYADARIHVIEASGRFSRARALDRAATELQADDLMFFVDVDISFTDASLKRIRRNARPGTLYFPVVFSQYDPKMVMRSSLHSGDMEQINEITGFWRQFGFGIAALYKADYEAIGKFDLTIEGWGKEDVDLYQKAVRSDLEIFRAPDVGLVHVHHEIKCDSSLSQHQHAMCLGTRADTYASTQQLASLIYENPQILNFAKAKVAATYNTSSLPAPPAA